MQEFWNRLNVEVLVTQFATWLPSVIAALFVLLGFWVLFRISRVPLRRAMYATHMDRALADMLLSIYRFVLLAFGLVMAASQMGIQVGAALAGLGVAGLTLGFAAKDTLSNTIAGFLIFWDRPFRSGEWVTIGGHYGRVAEITMRTTRIRTRSNKWVIIPNEKVINDVLVNHSAHGSTRIEVPVGIAYKEDIRKAREVILAAISRLPLVIPHPEPAVVVSELGNSSVDLLVFAWFDKAEDEKPAYFSVLEAAKYALDEAGIQIPFPHLQLFVDSVEDRVWDRAADLVSDVSADRRSPPRH